MRYATVVFFNRANGWGFATPDSGTENDVFLHVSQLPSDRKFLLEGDRITYRLGEHDGRPLAVDIAVISQRTPLPTPASDTDTTSDPLASLGAPRSKAVSR